MKFPKFYLGKMIEEKQRNEGLLGTIFFLMGYLRLDRGDNATGIQPIDFGKVGSEQQTSLARFQVLSLTAAYEVDQ